MYKLFLFLSFFLIFAFKQSTAFPKQPTAGKFIPLKLKVDRSRISLRTFNTKTLAKYRHDPEFNYHVETSSENSLWDRFWRWLWHIIENLFEKNGPSTQQQSTPLIKYLLITVIVALLIYLIMKVLHVENIFSRNSTHFEITATESLENIHQIIFDKEIETAIIQRNYRLAVRLLYLRSLKQLNDAQLINWQIEKPNSTYLNELTDSNQRRLFSVLTRQFEYIWYGDFPIDGQLFKNIHAVFQDFKNTL